VLFNALAHTIIFKYLNGGLLYMSINQTREGLRISARSIFDEFIVQGVPATIIKASSNLVSYIDVRGKSHLLVSTCSDKSSAAGKSIADSKVKTMRIAEHLGIPLPAFISCRNIQEAQEFLGVHSLLVTKPTTGSGGSGVTTNISTDKELTSAFEYANKYSRRVVVQQHITGDDVRVLIVGGKFCSAVIRKPASIVGNGILTIKELIKVANTEPSRNDETRSSLMHINLVAAERFLGNAINTILRLDNRVRVIGPSNVSLGGSVHEATHLVTPSIITDSIKITQQLGLGICGVDIMWDRKTDKHYIIEVNATPGLDLHNDLFSGTSSDAVEKYVQWLIA
jgi:cyanophycin synthetase